MHTLFSVLAGVFPLELLLLVRLLDFIVNHLSYDNAVSTKVYYPVSSYCLFADGLAGLLTWLFFLVLVLFPSFKF